MILIHKYKVTNGLDEKRLAANSDGDLIVALRFLPNIELIVTILALTKCGLAYVPIAPNWPAGRIRLILQNAKPAMVITNTRVDLLYKAMEEMDNTETFPSIHQVCIVFLRLRMSKNGLSFLIFVFVF